METAYIELLLSSLKRSVIFDYGQKWYINDSENGYICTLTSGLKNDRLKQYTKIKITVKW